MALHLSSGQPEAGRGPAGKPACSGPRGEDGGQGRQPRAGRGIDGSSGVPACRYRVAEIGCRDRGPEKRTARPLRSRKWNRVGRRRGLHLEVSIVDLRRKTNRRKAARASSDRATPRVGPTHHVVGLTVFSGSLPEVSTWDRRNVRELERRNRRKAPRIASVVSALHGARNDSQSRLRRAPQKGAWHRRSSERTARRRGGATGVSEAKIDSTFSGAGMTGATPLDGGARGENPLQETSIRPKRARTS